MANKKITDLTLIAAVTDTLSIPSDDSIQSYRFTAAQMKTYMQTAFASLFVPTGSVLDYAGSSAPTGFLLCYGQAISRTTYAALFAAIGTTFGVGDGSTTFNVPDLRGRVGVGKDDMGGSAANRVTSGGGAGFDGAGLGNNGGYQAVQLTSSQMPSHTHTANHSHTVTGRAAASGDHYHNTSSSPAFISTLGNGGSEGYGSAFASGASTDSASVTTSSAGGTTAHLNMQPSIILNKIIKI